MPYVDAPGQGSCRKFFTISELMRHNMATPPASRLLKRRNCLYVFGVITFTPVAAGSGSVAVAAPRTAAPTPADPGREKPPGPRTSPRMDPRVPRSSTTPAASGFGRDHRHRKRGFRPSCSDTSTAETRAHGEDEMGASLERLCPKNCTLVQLTA